ncbi:MAG: restriction endonuclease subunit S, partial [Nitrospira sp.]
MKRGWQIRPLEELVVQDKAGIKIGPFGSQLKKCDLVSNGIHVLGIENVLSGKFDELGERYISQEKFQTLESVEVVPGDLLLTMMGTIGKVAVVPPSIRRSIMDSHLLRMRPDQRVIRTDYLAWAIQGSTAVLDAIEAQAHGAIMKGLNSAIVRSLPVPVPPLAEQQQIVGKLE